MTIDDAGGADLSKSDGGKDGAPPSCGDGVCTVANGEACDNCPADCGQCQPCPAGFGDCNNTRVDGCETNLNTAQHCGSCTATCQAQGGSNPCVLDSGTMTYACSPMCDATHGDCDSNLANGCETPIDTTQNCGACGATCVNPHGATVCTTGMSGPTCVPTCDTGWLACGTARDGCTTDITSDVNNCGACGHACSTLHASMRSCQAGVCQPTCQAPWSDCSSPSHPAIDNGCESNGLQDPGELNNNCSLAQTIDVDEGDLVSRNMDRILPDGDTDTYRINLLEGSELCFPFTDQFFQARVVLLSPDGNLNLRTAQPSVTQCTDTWQTFSNYMCLNWSGTCGFTDDVTVFFQVYGPGLEQSCQPYQLFVEYCFEGTNCPGC